MPRSEVRSPRWSAKANKCLKPSNCGGSILYHIYRSESQGVLGAELAASPVGTSTHGDTDNLVLCATTQEGLEEAESAIYMGLLERGWEHLEIAGDRRAGGGIAGGNLRVFSAGGARMGMMR